MKLGVIGLGKMGSRIVFKLLSQGHEVVVWNRSSPAVDQLKLKIQSSRFQKTLQNLKVSATVENLILSLENSKIIWSMLPAGDATESILQEVGRYVQKGDIIIDGGNAFYKDTERRYQECKEKGIRFLGIGVSGGVIAEEEGYPLMAGGDKSAYDEIKPLLDSLAKPGGGHMYLGEGGAGHFVKMVHNGIEYGMMQAIGEGFGVLDKAPYTINLLDVAKIWQNGTIVSGFLIDRVKDALEKNVNLSDIQGIIAASGEGEWTVTAAKEEGVPIENIEQSLDFRKRSQTDTKIQQSFAAKIVAALRHEFGGHEVKKNN